jgi:hypothetical protein
MKIDFLHFSTKNGNEHGLVSVCTFTALGVRSIRGVAALVVGRGWSGLGARYTGRAAVKEHLLSDLIQSDQMISVVMKRLV